MASEPIYDVAHLGRVELLTPTLDASLDFFVSVLGMDEVDQRGDSVYLRRAARRAGGGGAPRERGAAGGVQRSVGGGAVKWPLRRRSPAAPATRRRNCGKPA